MQSQPQVVAQPRIQSAMQQVYLWMTAGLLVTGAVSSMVMGNESILASISNPIVFFGLIIAEVILVIALSATIMKLSPAMATGLFLFYAMLNGINQTRSIGDGQIPVDGGDWLNYRIHCQHVHREWSV